MNSESAPRQPRATQDDRYRELLRLFEQAPGFVTYFRGPDHVFELQNEAHAQLAGRKDIIGKPVREAVPELAGQGFYEMLDRVFETGEPFVGRAMPLRVNPADGGPAEEHFIDFVCQPIIGDDGEVVGIMSQGNDVTGEVLAQAEVRRKQAELEAVAGERTRALDQTRDALSLVGQLQVDKNKLLQLFGQAPGFIAVLRGPAHVYEMTNAAYDRMIAHRPVLGKPVREALPELAGQGLFELLDQVYSSAEPFVGHDIEVQIGTPPHRIFVDFVYQPLLGADGTANGILVQGSDVTERKLAQDEVRRYQDTLELQVAERTQALEEARAALQQSQKLESIGKLTGGVAHDFNNVLQIVGGNLQLLETHIGANPEAAQRLRAAIDAVERGAKLSSQLLAFARRQPLRPLAIDLGRRLEGMNGLLRQALGDGVEVHTSAGDGLWCALVDPHLLENAVLNLALNAADAMECGGRLDIAIANATLDQQYVEAHPDAADGEYVMVAVADTGSGMAPEVLERAIEPFFSTKPENRGTGLGLSMVYGFVKQSGGHLQIDSTAGSGTTVRMYFPRSFEAEADIPATAAGPVRGGTETILVVEDDKAVQETVVATLAGLGYRVIRADNGENALEILQSGVAPDLLFTDVVMPGLPRSPELARLARALVPGIEVLFTSGYTQDAISQGGRLDPDVELLSKPYRREQLARKLREILDGRSRPGALPEPPAAGAGKPRVLVVEDNDDARQMACDVLDAFGYPNHAAVTAEEALEVLARQRFDVIFTDYILPGMNGAQLALQCREHYPHMRVIVTSGYGQAIGERHPGLFSVLPKPYKLAELQALLEED